MKIKSKIILFLGLIMIGLFPIKIYCQNTVIKYSLLKETDDGLKVEKKNVTISETKNHFFEKYVYVGHNLDSVCLYDKMGNLYDGLYQNAITIYEYSNNKLTFVKLFNKNRQRVENGFWGYWSIEYLYDTKGRITKEINRNKNNVPVKYNYNIDMVAPYLEYEYLTKDSCIEKDFDNNHKLIREVRCACPDTSGTRLSQYLTTNLP